MHKRKLSIFIVPIAVLTLFAISKPALSETNFVVGIGSVSSPEQDDIMSETYSDYSQSGSGSMLDLELGVSFDLTEGLSIAPKFNLIAYRAEFSNSSFGGTGSTKSNMFSVPGVSMQYLVGDKKLGVYFGGYYGISSVSSDFSRVERIESDGNITGYFVGVMIEKFHLEFGTLKIPATIETDSVPETSADFGGSYFMLKRSL